MAEISTTEAQRNQRNQRQIVLIGGGALALAIVLLAVWYLFIRTPYAPAFTGLKTADAALIVDELKKQKTPYVLAENGTVIEVPQDQVDATRLAILGGDLPLKGTIGFELFNKSDMGLTEFAQKINYQRALQGELARTLMTLDNVEAARVHITLPDDAVFEDDRRPAKASVTLTPKLGSTIEARTIVGIQRLTASAVEGLDAMNVVVLDASGRQLSGDVPAAAPDYPEGAGQDQLEQRLSSQIRTAVQGVVKDPALRISVAAPPGAEQTSTGPASGPAQGAARSFPVAVTLAFSQQPAADLKVRLLPLLQGAIAFDEARGDTLALTVLPGSSPFEVGQPIATTTGGVRKSADWEASKAGPDLAGWIIPALLAALVLAAALVLLRRSRPAALSTAERADFAERLQLLLAERGGAGNGGR